MGLKKQVTWNSKKRWVFFYYFNTPENQKNEGDIEIFRVKQNPKI